MNLLIHFFLIHFLADYPFQPNSLVNLKKKSYWGVLLHCLIHLTTLIIVLLPFLHLKKVLIGIAVIFITHNIIDQTKVYLDKKHPKLRLHLYLLDQITHLLIITCASFYIGSVTVPDCVFYSDPSVVLYVLLLVLSTYCYDVTAYFIRSRKKAVPYKRNYKLMFWNVFIVSIAFAIYWMAY